MTIDEAIEILKARTSSRPLIGKHEVYGAIQLGIEALKKWKILREGRAGVIDPLLPGETLT